MQPECIDVRGDVAAPPLPTPRLPRTSRSDHAPFWDVDYPGLMVTDTANYRNPNYHCAGGPDAVADLDLDFAVRGVQVVVGAAAAALDRP